MKNLKPTASEKDIKKVIDNYISILLTLEEHKFSKKEFDDQTVLDKVMLKHTKNEVENTLGRVLFLLKLSDKENRKWVDYSNDLLIERTKLSDDELASKKICVYRGQLTTYGRERAKVCEGGYPGCTGAVKPCVMNIDEFKHISPKAGTYTAPRCKNCWDNSNGEFDE